MTRFTMDSSEPLPSLERYDDARLVVGRRAGTANPARMGDPGGVDALDQTRGGDDATRAASHVVMGTAAINPMLPTNVRTTSTATTSEFTTEPSD
jgi:hypothetical protein